MAWVTLSVDRVKTRLTAMESTAIQSVLTDAGDVDPLPDIVTQVVLEIRGYISGSGRKLNVGITIPESLINCAISRIRYELANAIPSASLMTPERIRENDAAHELLKMIKLEGFIPESATDVDPQHVHYNMPDSRPKDLKYDQAAQNGL